MTTFIKVLAKCAVALSLFCGFAFAQSANQDEPQNYTASYLRVNGDINTSVSFGSSGGTKALTVSTDGGDYDISSMPVWCSSVKYGASFSLTCAPNEASSDRSGWFNVISGGRTVKVAVSQSGTVVSSSKFSSFANEHRIDVSSSASYYFKLGKGGDFDSGAPAIFRPTHMYNLSLSMGMNVYKGISAYFDLGINNKAVDWAGRIGSKYFDLQLEYNFIGGEVSYWENADIGAKKNTPPDLKSDYDQTWLNVALMYRTPIHPDGDTLPWLMIGLFYNSAKVPALVWVNREKKDGKDRFAFLDKSCPVNTYGVRLYWDNMGFKRVPDDLPGGWTMKVPLRFIGDLGLGFADPDDEVVAMAKEKGGEFSDYSFITGFFGCRLALSFEFFNRFTEKQIAYFGFGIELNVLGYPNNEKFDNWNSIGVGGCGPIVRAGYAW